MVNEKGEITPDGLEKYKKTVKGGLTLGGLRYWVLNRIGAKGHFMFGGGGPLPEVDEKDPEIGMPEGWVTEITL